MLRKVLCFLGYHDWINIFDENWALTPRYRYCPHCKRCQRNSSYYFKEWYRVEDIKDNSTIENLERIYNNS